MAAWRSTMERKTPRFRRRLASLAKKPSTALSQEQEVGVKWKVKRGWRPSQARTFGMLVGGVVVEDDVDGLADRHLRLDGVEEADELLMPVALHVLADDGAVEHVEGGEQRGRAVALVVVGHGAGAALLHAAGRAGCGRAPGSGSSRRPTARWRAPADRHRGRQRRVACRLTERRKAGPAAGSRMRLHWSLASERSCLRAA